MLDGEREMTRHIAGESKADRKYRRIVEHNERILTKDLHLDLDKYYEEDYKRLGEKRQAKFGFCRVYIQ